MGIKITGEEENKKNVDLNEKYNQNFFNQDESKCGCNSKCNCNCDDSCNCDCECSCGCDCDCNCNGDCDCDCDCNCSKDDDDYISEYSPKELLNVLEDEFSETIKKRGSDYYENNRILSLYKYNDVYASRVLGSDNKEYTVVIDTNSSSEIDIDYNCNCPCDYPCKHIYATLLAISNLKYKEIDLLPEFEKEETNVEDIINKLDSNELKSYLINNVKNNEICFNQDDFNKYFYKYSKEQSYEYYYNKLYNSLMFDNYGLIEDYLEEINMCINADKYKEAYKIFKSIIEVYYDLNYLSNYNFVKNIPMLKMYLKMLCETDIRELYLYLTNLKNKDFYDNIYLKYLISDVM